MKRLIASVAAGLLALPVCADTSAAPSAAGTWQRHDPTEPVRGLDGKEHRASCSGFPGTDARFSFWTRQGRSRHLLIYFEGGGACWDNTSCSFPMTGQANALPQFFMAQIPPGTNPATMGGVLQTDNPANPVADWDMVYIPYCTGDLHTGSTTKTYTSVGHPVLGIPPGTPMTLKHGGFDNFMVVMDWVKRHIKDPKKVLVAGSSAGGYGATVNAPWVAQHFDDAPFYVLADASQGVTVPGFDNGDPGRNSWKPQWHKPTFGTGNFPGSELMRRAAQADRKGRYGQFTTSFDAEQIQFYGAMVMGYGGASCMNPANPAQSVAVDWHNKASAQLVADASDLRNYRHYVAAGQYHMVLHSPAYYAEQSAGPVFADWLRDMLQGRGKEASANGQGHGHGGHWNNAACPGCLAQLPCP